MLSVNKMGSYLPPLGVSFCFVFCFFIKRTNIKRKKNKIKPKKPRANGPLAIGLFL